MEQCILLSHVIDFQFRNLVGANVSAYNSAHTGVMTGMLCCSWQEILVWCLDLAFLHF